MRLKTSIEELAWIVDSEPSLPWLIALSMVTISSPSTSPTMTREGFMRRLRRTRLGHRDLADALGVGQALLEGHHVGVLVLELVSPRLRARSTVMSRSCGGISAAIARSIVVFPELVAPAIMMFLRAATAARRKRMTSSVKVLVASRSSRLTWPRRARRIDRLGRWHTPITAERREPSGRRRSSCGLAESNGREVRLTLAARIWMVR